MSAGRNAGKDVAPWECDLRLIRAGGRSRGLQSKAWTGRGPGGSWIFANLQKSTTAQDFPRATSFPAGDRPMENGRF